MNERTVFLNALDKRDLRERAAYLDEACAGSPALRQRIEALLRSHAEAGCFLAVPAVPGANERMEPMEAIAASAAPAVDDELVRRLRPSQEVGALGRLDHYELLERVGRGSMGIVFKARDTQLRRIVAIKVLAPALADLSDGRQRFIREARAAAAIRDDHVVAIHAVCDDASVPYMVVEYIAGMTLDDRLRRAEPFALDEVLRIGMQIAGGLAAAHAQGLIHRDIKPSNILLENDVQRVKITDFGLARAANDANLTQVGVIAGSPLYMSPEQARGEEVDHRTDLFSLGSVLYALCTGRPPFRAENALAVLRRVSDDDPMPIRDLSPDIPDWLCGIVARLQEKGQAQRFQTAAEVAGLLAQQLARLQGPQPGQGQPAAPTRRSSRWARLAVVAALFLGVLGWVGVSFRPSEKSTHAVSGKGTGPKQLFVDPARALEDIVDFRDLAGATFEELRDWLAQLPPEFRLAPFTSRRGTGAPLFNAVAVREKTPHRARFSRAVTSETHEADWQRNDLDGFRPLAICTYWQPGQKAAWTQGRLWIQDKKDRLGQYTWQGSLEDVKADAALARKAGCRTFYLDCRPTLNGAPYQGIAAADNRESDPVHSFALEELLPAVAFYRDKGWRPDVLAPCWDGDRLRFLLVAVSNEDGPEWRFRMEMTLEQYREESARQRRRGLFPLALASYGNDAGVRYVAIWVRGRVA